MRGGKGRRRTEWWGGDGRVKGWFGDKGEEGVTKEVELIKQRVLWSNITTSCSDILFSGGETRNSPGTVQE